jgi:hypothetical protein
MLEAAGGNSSVTVTTQPECAWTAATNANWISGLSPSSGQGSGSVSFRVAANDGSSVREGTIVINDEQARVSQRAPCRFTLTPPSQSVATSGGTSTVSVATDSDCAWTATTDAAWISLETTGGTGPAAIEFTVPANQGGARTGAIIVSGQRATVTQSAAAPQPPTNCNATISPTSQNMGAGGGAGTPIAVVAASECPWAAASNVSWLTITSGSTNSGNGTVTFSVAANTGAARSGTLSIAGRVFTVTQDAAAPAACAYSIAPTSQNAPAAASTGTVNVTTTAACAWTASSNAQWITVTSGATGTGNGAVGFSVAANTGGARTGTVTIASQTFSVMQAAGTAPCTYSISPTSQNVDATASTTTVAVTTAAGCTWTATSGVPWITITAGASGSGNGSVGLSVAANTGSARTGTVNIGGQVFTVNQAAPVPACTYSISPTSQNLPALGGSGSVTVTAASGCTWTATVSSNSAWLTITSGASGSGNGSVAFAASANVAASRTGTLTVAGQTFTVTQAGVVGRLSRAGP